MSAINSFPTRPVMIGSEIYRRSIYGVKHPLSIQRVSPVIDLCQALGWLDDGNYIEGPVASFDQLTRFHTAEYVAALVEAEKTRTVSEAVKERHNIGRNGNPVYPEIFSRPATAAGSTLLAADMLARADRGIIHSLAGGTHHGRPDQASGFCFFNDPVLSILHFLDHGLERVYYVDLDAHHGDGVQDAFHDDERVLTVSVHEEGRWPRTGPLDDRAGGMARNIPVPQGLNDSELAVIVAHALVPLGETFGPEALVIQGGADGLEVDPQSKLELSNRANWDAVKSLLNLAPRVLLLGGGGYNPWGVARSWTGLWAVINGLDPVVDLNDAAQAVLERLTWNHSRGRNPPRNWFETLADTPNEGPVRREICDAIETVMRR